MLRRIARNVKRNLFLVKKPVAFETFYVFERDIDFPLPEVKSELDVGFREAQPTDVPQFLTYNGNPVNNRQAGKIINRMSRGDRCTIGIHDGQIIGYRWVTESRFMDDPISFPPGYCFTFGAYVARPFRGQGVNQEHSLYMKSFLLGLGIHTNISVIDSKNQISLHTGEKKGGRMIGKIRRSTLLNRWKLEFKSSSLKSYLKVLAEKAPPMKVGAD